MGLDIILEVYKSKQFIMESRGKNKRQPILTLFSNFSQKPIQTHHLSYKTHKKILSDIILRHFK